jgi:hypothetical protein
VTATQFLAMLDGVGACQTIADLAAHERLIPHVVRDPALLAVLAEAVRRRTGELADADALAVYVAAGGALPGRVPLSPAVVDRLALVLRQARDGARGGDAWQRVAALYAGDPALASLRFSAGR